MSEKQPPKRRTSVTRPSVPSEINAEEISEAQPAKSTPQLAGTAAAAAEATAAAAVAGAGESSSPPVEAGGKREPRRRTSVRLSARTSTSTPAPQDAPPDCTEEPLPDTASQPGEPHKREPKRRTSVVKPPGPPSTLPGDTGADRVGSASTEGGPPPQESTSASKPAPKRRVSVTKRSSGHEQEELRPREVQDDAVKKAGEEEEEVGSAESGRDGKKVILMIDGREVEMDEDYCAAGEDEQEEHEEEQKHEEEEQEEDVTQDTKEGADLKAAYENEAAEQEHNVSQEAEHLDGSAGDVKPFLSKAPSKTSIPVKPNRERLTYKGKWGIQNEIRRDEIATWRDKATLKENTGGKRRNSKGKTPLEEAAVAVEGKVVIGQGGGGGGGGGERRLSASSGDTPPPPTTTTIESEEPQRVKRPSFLRQKSLEKYIDPDTFIGKATKTIDIGEKLKVLESSKYRRELKDNLQAAGGMSDAEKWREAARKKEEARVAKNTQVCANKWMGKIGKQSSQETARVDEMKPL